MFAAETPPLIEFCVTNEAEQTIHGAWIDLAPHRRQGVQRRSVESGATACGVLPATQASPPVLRLQREGGGATACRFPTQPQGRRYVFSFHANAEIGEHCELLTAIPRDAMINATPPSAPTRAKESPHA